MIMTGSVDRAGDYLRGGPQANVVDVRRVPPTPRQRARAEAPPAGVQVRGPVRLVLPPRRRRGDLVLADDELTALDVLRRWRRALVRLDAQRRASR